MYMVMLCHFQSLKQKNAKNVRTFFTIVSKKERMEATFSSIIKKDKREITCAEIAIMLNAEKIGKSRLIKESLE